LWKVRKENKEEGSQEEEEGSQEEEEEVRGVSYPLFSGRFLEMAKMKRTSNKAGKAAKKRGNYMGKEVRAAKSR
jgi:hypothetical protein